MTWVRDTMYEALKPTVSNLTSGKMVLIGGKSPLTKYVSSAVTIIQTNQPSVDAENMPYSDNEWDYLLSDQMLEHVRHPWKAVSEMYRVVKPGGLVICTTCSYNPIHNHPIDCYRFFPEGMKSLFEDFNKVEVQSWGSKEAMIYDIQTNGKRQTYPVQKQAEAKRKNDNNLFPWTIWVKAYK